MTALVSLLTTLVETVNVVVMPPAGMVTLLPTKALRLDDASETVVPPVGAGPEMLRVPVVVVVLAIDADANETLVTFGPRMLSVDLSFAP